MSRIAMLVVASILAIACASNCADATSCALREPDAETFDDDLSDSDETAMLQVSGRSASFTQLHSEKEAQLHSLSKPSQMPCKTPHPEDLKRPISEVRKEHPDLDLFCYFAPHVPWFHPLYETSGYRYNATWDEVKSVFVPYLGHHKGELTTWHFDGAPASGLTAYMDAMNYIYDDPYCYTLGFLKNQLKTDGITPTNYSAWKKLAVSECDKFQSEYNFAPEEVTVDKHVKDNPKIMTKSYCAAGLTAKTANKFLIQAGQYCTEGSETVTAREYKLHAYAKCALGDESGEMAYCYRRGCLLKDHKVGDKTYANYIGHGPEECGAW